MVPSGYPQEIEALAAGDVNGVAMSLPGTIDSNNGFAISGRNPTHNIVQKSGRTAKKKIWLSGLQSKMPECTALAETVKNTEGCSKCTGIAIGTGIGGAISRTGRSYKGSHLYAGVPLFYSLQKDISKYGGCHIREDRSHSIFQLRDGKKLGKKLEGPNCLQCWRKDARPAERFS